MPDVIVFLSMYVRKKEGNLPGRTICNPSATANAILR